MLLKVNEPHAPQHGDTRRIAHFALWPKRIGGVLVWLRQWEELQAWNVMPVAVRDGKELTAVAVGQWITISKKPVKWIAA